MGLFDPLIVDFHTNVKPTLLSAGREARAYGRQICDRLEHIHRELTVDRDPGETMASPALLPANASIVRVFTVPAGEEYVLEAASTDTTAAVFFRLLQDNNFRLATSNSVRTEPIRFKGPCDIHAGLSAAGVDTLAQIQLRRLAKRARPTQSGGMIETGLDPVSALRTHDPLHAGIGIG